MWIAFSCSSGQSKRRQQMAPMQCVVLLISGPKRQKGKVSSIIHTLVMTSASGGSDTQVSCPFNLYHCQVNIACVSHEKKSQLKIIIPKQNVILLATPQLVGIRKCGVGINISSHTLDVCVCAYQYVCSGDVTGIYQIINIQKIVDKAIGVFSINVVSRIFFFL